MNRNYLGDALDHFKGAVLRHLQDTRDLRDLAADPMVTDPESWSEAEYDLYARLIHVEQDRVVTTGGSLNPRTRRHIGPPIHDGDVFLDPDTGIRTRAQSPLRRFVRPREIVSLLESGGVVAVYQHAWRVASSGG